MKKQWKWVVGIAIFCILAPIVSFAMWVVIYPHTIDSGAATVASFLEDLRGRNFTAAHALMAPSEQAVVSVTDLQAAQEQIEKKKERWLLPAAPNEYHPNAARDHITYFYTMQPDKGYEMFVKVRVVRTDNGWRVLEYQYDDDPA